MKKILSKSKGERNSGHGDKPGSFGKLAEFMIKGKSKRQLHLEAFDRAQALPVGYCHSIGCGKKISVEDIKGFQSRAFADRTEAEIANLGNRAIPRTCTYCVS